MIRNNMNFLNHLSQLELEEQKKLEIEKIKLKNKEKDINQLKKALEHQKYLKQLKQTNKNDIKSLKKFDYEKTQTVKKISHLYQAKEKLQLESINENSKNSKEENILENKNDRTMLNEFDYVVDPNWEQPKLLKIVVGETNTNVILNSLKRFGKLKT